MKKSRVLMLALGLGYSLLAAGFTHAQGFAAPPRWTSLGPFGGNVNCLAVDPTDPSVLYASTSQDGLLFKSTNGGSSWKKIRDGSASVIVIDPDQPSRILIASGYLYESLDAGITWKKFGYIPVCDWLILDPQTPTTMYLGSYSMVWKSTDNGLTWVAFQSGAANYSFLRIDPDNSTVLYLNTSNGLFLSQDGGTTWQSITAGLPDNAVNDLTMDPVNSSILYVATHDGIYKSNNQGGGWAALGPPGQEIGRLYVHPASPSTLYALGSSLFRTQDGGGSWQEFKLDALTTGEINAFALDPQSALIIYAGTRFGISTSRDGGASWLDLNTGLTGIRIDSLAVNPFSSTNLYAVGNGFYKSMDLGGNWVRKTGVSGDNLSIHPLPPLTIFCGVDKSIDGGDHWTSIGPSYGYPGPIYFRLELDPKDPATIYLLGRFWGVRYVSPPYLWKTTDGGKHWMQMTGADEIQISVLAIDPQNPAILYAGAGTGVYKSSDGGVHWTKISGLLPSWMTCLVVDPQKTSTLYAGTRNGGIFKSLDDGGTWAAANEGLTNPNGTIPGITGLALDPLVSSTIFAAGSGGVFRSGDGAKTWSPLNDGLPNPNVHALAIDPQNPQNVYAATDEGVFSISLSSPWIHLSRAKLHFGAVKGGAATPPQTILVTKSGSGTPAWTATKDRDWITIVPAQGSGPGVIQVGVTPSGLDAGTYSGTLTIDSPDAANSPQSVEVTLTIYAAGAGGSPFGFLDTPLDGTAGVEGSIPISGWALDDIEVTKVQIWRDPMEGEAPHPFGYVYIGEAVFVEGARPDVEQAYPAYPLNIRAGWGYMMLTNFLPNRGNGTFRIHATATDPEGHTTLLGSKTIICNNAQASLPFGTIDTPSQGGTAAGNAYINYGWVLTPVPKMIPTDGSTITAWVDGVPVGHPSYGYYREDIAALFPRYANAGGAIGYIPIDTTKLPNGVHTIVWSATDNAGVNNGFGSRYFTVLNPEAGTMGVTMDESLGKEGLALNRQRPVFVRRGYDLKAVPNAVYPDKEGMIVIESRELERIEIALFERAGGGEYRGYSIGPQGESRPLPIGSVIDRRKGIFVWQPGAGFVGEYDFMFRGQEPGGKWKIRVRVMIRPKL